MSDYKMIECLCFGKPIPEIIKEAKKKNLKSIDEILEKIECGTACGMCVPYIEKAFKKAK